MNTKKNRKNVNQRKNTYIKNAPVNGAQKKKKFSKEQIIVFVLMVIWTIGSVLGAFSFIENRSKGLETIQTSADTVSENGNEFVHGSKLYLANYVATKEEMILKTMKSNVAISMTFRKTENILNISLSAYLISGSNDESTYKLYSFYNSTGVPLVNLGNTVSLTKYSNINYVKLYLSCNEYYYTPFELWWDSDFDFSKISQRSVSYFVTESTQSLDLSLQQVAIEFVYTDFNHNKVKLRFMYGLWQFPEAFVSAGLKPDYLYLPIEELVYFNGDTWYNNGFIEGNTTGLKNGYQNGYDKGFDAGANEQYNFLSLFTAVVDAPIQAFLDMIDFEILGYNMQGLALGLFSIALILGIIKFIF